MIKVDSKNSSEPADIADLSQINQANSPLELPKKDLFQAEIQNLKKLGLTTEVTDLTVKIAQFFERPVAALQLLIQWAPAFTYDFVNVAKAIVADCERFNEPKFGYAYLHNVLRPQLLKAEPRDSGHISRVHPLQTPHEKELLVLPGTERGPQFTDNFDSFREEAARVGVPASRLYYTVGSEQTASNEELTFVFNKANWNKNR